MSTSPVLSEELLEPRRAGRPRDARIDEAVLRCVYELLQEADYASVTLELVSVRAGVSRPALKRRWSSKVALVVDAIVAHTPSVVSPDTGSLEGDLRAALKEVVRVWGTPRARLVYSALLAELDGDPAAKDRFRELQLRRGQDVAAALERAVQRGEIEPDKDVSLVADLLEGPVLHRRLISDLSPSPELLEASLRSTLDHLGVSSSTAAVKRRAKGRRRARA